MRRFRFHITHISLCTTTISPAILFTTHREYDKFQWKCKKYNNRRWSYHKYVYEQLRRRIILPIILGHWGHRIHVGYFPCITNYLQGQKQVVAWYYHCTEITSNNSQVFILREIFPPVPLNANHHCHQVLWLSGGEHIQINDATTEIEIPSLPPLYSRGHVWLQLVSSQPGDLAGAQSRPLPGG